MTKLQDAPAPSPEHPEARPLARESRTLSGARYEPSSDHWEYDDGLHEVSLKFRDLTGFSKGLQEAAKASLAWYAENRSPDHLDNLFQRLKHFARWLKVSGRQIHHITDTDFINYRSSLSPSTQWYVGSLAGLFKKWHSLGYAGVDSTLVLLLSQLKLKGNTKGTAVLTMDPETGPLTHIESEALQDALNDSYARGDIEEWEFILCWLYILLGQRNKQYAALKVCDVLTTTDQQGCKAYSLMMPRAKKRGVDIREQLKERRVVEQFGAALQAYAQRARAQFAAHFTCTDQAPLFPAQKRRYGAGQYEFHWTADDLGVQLKRILSGLSVVSERTGQQIHITSTRFRRTIGTRAAEEGHGPLVIAEMLDHSDTQNVGVYSANSPAIIKRIDRAIALQMAPLAQAFAGTLADGSVAGASANRIIDLRIDQSGRAMGKCGQHGFCGFAAPIACYTCRSFEAWIDGPHEAVLDHLLSRRENLLKTSDERMAAINDRTILAVAAVVQKCAELKVAKLPGASTRKK